jgi:hypothetical protein
MYFSKAKFFKLPNDEYAVILYASKQHYGDAIGVRKGVCLDETNKSFIGLAKYVLNKHKRVKNGKQRKVSSKGIR